MGFKTEEYVNDYVKSEFKKLGLKKGEDYNTETCMSDYLKEALKGSAKTDNKTTFGRPDFHLEGYDVPVIIENKLGLKKLLAVAPNDTLKEDENSIKNYAVNGALYYSTNIISSGKYDEAIAIGIAGDDENNIEIKVYYVYGKTFKSIKYMENYKTLDFLSNKEAFKDFYENNCKLTKIEKHKILLKTKTDLSKKAKQLNKLFNNHGIGTSERAIFVSGMILSMQDINIEGNISRGLIPDDLTGDPTNDGRDSVKIYRRIKSYLESKKLLEESRTLMLKVYDNYISIDKNRDKEEKLDKIVSKILKKDCSIIKQIFTYIYENIFLSIDSTSGDLDVIGELYNEFLKYAIGDGKGLGIVLTPPEVTKMMTNLIEVGKDSKVIDLCTGSAGFLISSLEAMIDDINITYGKNSEIALEKIKKVKENQVLGIEKDNKMFVLAITNLLLRGDNALNIKKQDTFKTQGKIYDDFKADKVLLNPPFSYKENGMPFILFGLDHIEKGGLGAIIIQESAGSGKAISTNKEILKKHTLIASIKMPCDLFKPMADVASAIYIFQAHKPHDYQKTVKFIDFRNDGYKRTSRGITVIDKPEFRYEDIVNIYKNGLKAEENLKADWGDLKKYYIEDFISENGEDWNFMDHKVIDAKPTIEDFEKTVGEYLSWEVSGLLK